MKLRVGHIGAGLRLSEVSWSVMACLFPDGTALLRKSARELQRAVYELNSLPKKLRVPVGKTKVIFRGRKYKCVTY